MARWLGGAAVAYECIFLGSVNQEHIKNCSFRTSVNWLDPTTASSPGQTTASRHQRSQPPIMR